MIIKGIIQDDAFYCDHLGANKMDENDIINFEVGHSDGKGLVNYLQYVSFPDEENKMMRTYLVRDLKTDELVGYYSLKAGLISINENEVSKKTDFDTISGVELANFAVL